MGSNETKTPGIARSPSLRGSWAVNVLAILTSDVMLEPTVRLEAVQNRAVVCLPGPGTGRDQIRESIFRVLESLNLCLDVGCYRAARRELSIDRHCWDRADAGAFGLCRDSCILH